jgi:hypothetical protein
MNLNIGDFMLADLYHYLNAKDPNSSRICAFMLGLVNSPWDRVKKVSLDWEVMDDPYNYKTTIVPRINIEFYEKGKK